MATAEVTAAVVDAIVSAFDSNPALFTAFLVRSRLETDLATLNSQIRKASAERDAGLASSESELDALRTLIHEKIAEIDAL